MRCNFARYSALVGLGLILCVGLSTGCYSRGYNNPYGYQQYPAYNAPGAPIQTLTPGGQYVPGGAGTFAPDGTYLGNPAPLGAPGQFDASPVPTPIPENNSNFGNPPSTFDPAPGGNDVNVPQPTDPYFNSPANPADPGGFQPPSRSPDPNDGRSF